MLVHDQIPNLNEACPPLHKAMALAVPPLPAAADFAVDLPRGGAEHRSHHGG